MIFCYLGQYLNSVSDNGSSQGQRYGKWLPSTSCTKPPPLFLSLGWLLHFIYSFIIRLNGSFFFSYHPLAPCRYLLKKASLFINVKFYSRSVSKSTHWSCALPSWPSHLVYWNWSQVDGECWSLVPNVHLRGTWYNPNRCANFDSWRFHSLAVSASRFKHIHLTDNSCITD